MFATVTHRCSTDVQKMGGQALKLLPVVAVVQSCCMDTCNVEAVPEFADGAVVCQPSKCMQHVVLKAVAVSNMVNVSATVS